MQNTNSLVTVICSCYNHSKYLKESLDSVINQTYKNIQLIIIDDCSDDNSVEVIENWISKNKIGLLKKNDKNLGLTKSFNKSFKYVEGDFFIDLAADDVLLPHCIETQISVYNAYPKNLIGIVYGNARVIDNNNNTLYTYYTRFSQSKKTTKPEDGFIYKEILNQSNIICSVSALIKKNIFVELGGYDEHLVYEDYDIWLRIARKHCILYVDDILVKKRKLNTSLGSTTTFLRFNKKTLKFKYATYCIVKKTFKMNLNKEEDRASIEKIYIEIKENLKNLNILLIIKYYILLLNFKFRKFNTRKT